ncbi:DUF1093 domain-containing protein [Pediococcus stilesii]|uniref:DUF1093 domain-containing protein n=1 Tax=Pediococcus stilesii TaxID=331679 RepID=A0A5R9BYD4_9LACO|nr:YxeA family protein [Pediococcus stilesii]TLQ05303.1 DUF1093 domain-containing protein [Pediococcus stilesii]
MKKIVSIIAAVLVIGAIFFGYKYYENTYKSVNAYAIVPEKVPAKVQTKDDSGKVVTGYHSYNYTFNFVTESGKKKTIEYELSGRKVQPFTPGATVKAEISNTRINKGPNYVNDRDVPSKVMNQLK